MDKHERENDNTRDREEDQREGREGMDGEEKSQAHREEPSDYIDPDQASQNQTDRVEVNSTNDRISRDSMNQENHSYQGADRTFNRNPRGEAYNNRSQAYRGPQQEEYGNPYYRERNPSNMYSGPYQGNPHQDPYGGNRYVYSNARTKQGDGGKKKSGGSWLKTIALVLVSAILGAGLSLVLLGSGLIDYPQSQEATTGTQSVEISLTEDATVENAVAQKAIPSIVGITSVVKGQSQSPFTYGIPQYMESMGSGVIVSEDGYILTNAHVVDSGNAEYVTVLFSNDEEEQAEVLWADPTLDLAVIKVDRTGLPAADLGDSDAVQVGDKAIAIGNPLGHDLQSTLTSGYISGLGRSITLQDGNIMDGLIQTDAAINSGNSGGALLNAEGQVVGINTARPQVADGIGFAIPINTAKPIVEKIIETGSYEPIQIGIYGYNAAYARAMGTDDLAVDSGVIIHEVIPDSPADKAGLEPGDIIVSIDDQAVDSMNGLKTVLVNYDIGDEATIRFYRGDQEEETQITFEEFIPQGPSRN